MTLRRVTGPTTLPITVAQAKANGRIDDDAEDAFIEGLIRAALAHAERWCGCAFESQVWEEVLDAFPTGSEIELTWGPVASVTSVKFTDPDGNEATLDPNEYVVDTFSRSGWAVLVAGGAWPSTMTTIGAVRVQYVAGTGTDPDVAQAILLLVELWYENRATASEAALKSIPVGAMSILDLHRRMFV